MLEGLLIGGVALIILNLVVRDQTEFRLSRLRSDLLALNSEEKRLAERRDEVELMVAQIGEALMRADRRQTSVEKGCGQLADKLEMIGSLTGTDPNAAAPDEAGEANR